ncbi:thiolase family protein [Pseudonocardia pini]|uniref:thiolase family protein n=1 Tax=Pseudonocardia pini TaxID=2758030 RepID=UPI001C68C6CD|nr:thiolase family protein [Pseudonocardia pini]
MSDTEPVFIGIGEQPSGRYPNRPFMGDLVRVGVAAVKDAGLTMTDIDTILLIPCLHSPADQADLVFSRIVEELGLNKKVKCQYMVHSGGSTSDNTIRTAAGLIDSGHAKNVLVLQAEKWGSAPVTEMIDMLTANGIPREWEKQSGVSFNAVGALIQQRYMFESGSTPADMASVCVALRDWANLNPNAMYKDKKLTVEQVLGSKMITDPIRAFECPMLADGACALVLTSRGNARKLGKDRVVRLAGEGGCVSHYSIGQEREVGKLGWEIAAPAAYEAAGWGPEDVDIAEIYDSYAAVLTSGLEGLGLAPKGEAARMFARGEFSPGGRLPVNTNGGLLSAGHTGVGGGTALLTEGVRQLLGRAGPERQVEGATRAALGGSGGTYMDSQVLLLEGVSA